MIFANNFDPDEAQQNVGAHLRSKLFDSQIVYEAKYWMETMIFCFERKKIEKNYFACKVFNFVCWVYNHAVHCKMI